MKRWTAALLAFAILCALPGCTRKAPAPKSPVSFYYPAVEVIYDGKTHVIQAETREGAGYEEDIAGLLNLYLRGPISETLRSPFPGRVTVSHFSTTANTAILELSSEFSQLVGIDLTLACACIANTLFDLTQLQRVQIFATDAMLDSQASITLERDDLYFTDVPAPVTDATEGTASSGQ